MKLLCGIIQSDQNAGLRVLFLTALILLFMSSGNSIMVILSLDEMVESADVILVGKIKGLENGPIITVRTGRGPIEYVSIHIEVKEIYKGELDKEYVELIYPAVIGGLRISTYVPKTVKLKTWDESKRDQGILVEDMPNYPTRVGDEWVWLLSESKVVDGYFHYYHHFPLSYARCVRSVAGIMSMKKPEQIPAFIKLLKSDDTQTVVSAIDILDNRKAKEAVKPVASLVPVQDEKIRERVHKYLLKINDNYCNLKLIEGLEFHIRNNTWPLRSNLLRDIKDRRVIPVLIEALEHDNDYWRRAAASTLGRLKAKEAVEGLMALFRELQFHVSMSIEDIKPSVRIEAVKALGEIGDRRVVPFLGAALLNTLDRFLDAKEEIAIALGKIGDRRAVPCLGEALLDAPDRTFGFKRSLIIALTEIGDEDALFYIGEALLKRNINITETTVKALVEIGDERALPYLEKALVRAPPSRRPFVEEAIEKLKKRQRIE